MNKFFVFFVSFTFLMLGHATSGVKVHKEGSKDAYKVKSGTHQISLDFAQAIEDGDAKAVANLYAENGILYGVDTDPIIGRPAILKFYQDFFSKFKSKIEIHDAHQLSDGQKLSTSWGQFTFHLIPKDGSSKEILIPGRFADVCVKEKDGKWRYVVDHASVKVASSDLVKPTPSGS